MDNFEDYFDQMELGELSEVEEDDNDSQESLTSNANDNVAANTKQDLGDILWRGYEKLHYEQPNKIFCANKINVQGTASDVKAFVLAIKAGPNPYCRVEEVHIQPQPLAKWRTFKITN